MSADKTKAPYSPQPVKAVSIDSNGQISFTADSATMLTSDFIVSATNSGGHHGAGDYKVAFKQ
jgi:hypothetical protein